MDYKNGKIYKIVSNNTDKIYIGSTCSTLSKRLYEHKKGYERFLSGKANYVTSYQLLEFRDVDIVLIEDFPCESKNHLHARERYWIEQNKNITVNKNTPNRTIQEIIYYQKEYRSNNKDKLYQPCECECGGRYTTQNKSHHLKTPKHQKHLEKQQVIEPL